MSQRILILMSRTGGGHLASAESLKAGFAHEYGDAFQVDIIDLLMDHLPWPLKELPRSYPFLSGRTPRLWKFLWQRTTSPALATPLSKLASRWSAGTITEALQQYAPDLIISVHPMVQELTLHALDVLEMHLPFVVVVTDLATAHPLWFHKRTDLCFVASQESYQIAFSAGLQAAQLRRYGLPVRPMFAEKLRPKAEARQELGMHDSLPAVLLMGGGEGIGRVGEIARAVERKLLHAGGRPLGQLVVICGHNETLQAELEGEVWRIPTLIQGFVHNMSDWMVACDCLITKAGPGTIAEALICGLPIVLSGYIPGQEEGNVPYVIDNGVGAYSEDPVQIAAIIGWWFGPGQDDLRRMSETARRMGKPQSTFEIVRDIAGLLAD